MRIEKEKAIRAARTWAAIESQKHELRLDRRFDATGLAHAILGDKAGVFHANMVADTIMEFAVNARPLTVDVTYRKTAETLIDTILENVPGITAAQETDLSAVAACNPEAVLAMMRG